MATATKTKVLQIQTSASDSMTYSFRVDGIVSATSVTTKISSLDPSDGSVEDNVTITRNSDGTYTVSGKTGGSYGDAFEVVGTISNFSASVRTSDVQLTLGGKSIDPSQFPISTADSTSGGDSGGSTGGDSGGGGQKAGFSIDRKTALTGLAAVAAGYALTE